MYVGIYTKLHYADKFDYDLLVSSFASVSVLFLVISRS